MSNRRATCFTSWGRILLLRTRRLALPAALLASAAACGNVFSDAIDAYDAGGGPEGSTAPVDATRVRESDEVDATAVWVSDAGQASGSASVSDATGTAAVEAGEGSVEATRQDAASDASSPRAARDASAPEDAEDAEVIVTAAPDAGMPESSGAVECAAPSFCVPEAPGGWEGPCTIMEAAGSALPALPGCPASSYPVDAFDGKGSPDAGPPACGCACSAPPGAGCQQPLLDLLAQLAGCRGCSSAPPDSGICVPDASVSVPPPSWASEARVCALPFPSPSAGGCSQGEVCVPPASFPVEEGTYCVATAGSSTCPERYYAVRHPAYYAGGSDTRGCSACSCGSPSGGCGGTPDTQGMHGMQGMQGMSSGTDPTSAVTCPAQGGNPTGAFTPTGAYTICCNQ